jgi:hypothetical protein
MRRTCVALRNLSNGFADLVRRRPIKSRKFDGQDRLDV